MLKVRLHKPLPFGPQYNNTVETTKISIGIPLPFVVVKKGPFTVIGILLFQSILRHLVLPPCQLLTLSIGFLLRIF